MVQGHHESLLETKENSGSVIVDGAMDGQVKHLLHQFEDVFRSPVGLPPERTIAHGIDFEPGDSLPNSRSYSRLVMENEEIK